MYCALLYFAFSFFSRPWDSAGALFSVIFVKAYKVCNSPRLNCQLKNRLLSFALLAIFIFHPTHLSTNTQLMTRGQKSLKLFNSMTWSDQNCPTKGAYIAMIFLLEKCVTICDIFINSYFFILGTIPLLSQIMRNYCSADHVRKHHF